MCRSIVTYCALLLMAVLFGLACTDAGPSMSATNEATPAATETSLPDLLQKALQAHGGLDRWRSMKSMRYTVERAGKPEQHLIDLATRRVLITHADYQVGFDGQEVWVAPNLAAFGDGSARFYHNLRFYFIAMPFVVADPGINYEVLPPRTLQEKSYDALRITYDTGVGDAPEDEYILHFDQETHRMEWLLYTVTYYTGQPGDQYNALHYSDWQEVNGLLLPAKMIGYRYQQGTVGEQRYERQVIDLQMETTAVDPARFAMPAQAEVDSLVTH